MKSVVKILKKQAKLHRKIDKLDAEFRAAAEDCEFRQNNSSGGPVCCHEDQGYTYCDRFVCPLRDDLFLSPPSPVA